MEDIPFESTGCNILIVQVNDNNLPKELPVNFFVNDSQAINAQFPSELEKNKEVGSNIRNLVLTPLLCHDVKEKPIYLTNIAETAQKPSKKTLSKNKPKTSLKKQKTDNDSATSMDWSISKHRIMNNVHISDKVLLPRAIAVLPLELQIRLGVISPKRMLPPRTRFGPVQGLEHLITHEKALEIAKERCRFGDPVFFSNKTPESVLYIDGSDKDKSNWLALLKVGNNETANVWLYEENGELYGMTIHEIPSRTRLLLGYSLQYAEKFGIPPGSPVINLHDVCKQWCFECRIAEKKPIPSRIRNIYKTKKSPEITPAPQYRCKYCHKTFRRLFTLKRHTRLFCNRKIEPIKPPVNDTTIIQPISNNSSCMDDCRVPSDESLNFTNILDFPTNLFDTDRINLDISGSSRSDDFNSNIEGLRDNVSDKNNKKTEEADVILTTCPYCYLVVVKDTYKQHFRTCPKRACTCACGLKCINKQALIHHMQKEHPEKLQQTTQNSSSSNDQSAKYKCKQCQHSFKRRGMLVNHLWRIHNKQPTSVPLERPVKHYPCGVELCPKIYRAKAKRDRHVAKYHPGCHVKVNAIEEAPRPASPAVCTHCPRQYATKAKLKQHVKQRHPHLLQTLVCSTPQPNTTSGT